MLETYIEDIETVLRYKKKLERDLSVKITSKGRIVFIEGDGDKEFLADQVLKAIDLGFSVNRALLLKNPEFILHILYIKDITKRKDLDVVRGRIIGTHGKTLKTLNNLSDCLISLKDNNIGIIGESELIDEGIIALKALIQGSKQGNVYARLEKAKKKRRIDPSFYKNIKDESKKE